MSYSPENTFYTYHRLDTCTGEINTLLVGYKLKLLDKRNSENGEKQRKKQSFIKATINYVSKKALTYFYFNKTNAYVYKIKIISPCLEYFLQSKNLITTTISLLYLFQLHMLVFQFNQIQLYFRLLRMMTAYVNYTSTLQQYGYFHIVPGAKGFTKTQDTTNPTRSNKMKALSQQHFLIDIVLIIQDTSCEPLYTLPHSINRA